MADATGTVTATVTVSSVDTIVGDFATFAVIESGAEAFGLAGETLGTVTRSFPTVYRQAQVGRWRDYEG